MTEFQTNKPALFPGLAGFNEHWSLVIIAFYTFIPNLPRMLITLACKQTNRNKQKYYTFIPNLPGTLITLACKQTNKQKYYTFIPNLPQTLITSLTDTHTHRHTQTHTHTHTHTHTL